jgi:hypothetical protein
MFALNTKVTTADTLDVQDSVNKQDKWDGKYQWAMEQLFDDSSEEEVALLNLELPGHSKPKNQWLFQYGLRYNPPPIESDIYRTVKIEDLSHDVTLDQVLAQVCCGEVYSANLLNTMGLTGYHTAIVIFLYQKHAVDFAQYAQKEGIFVNGTRARISLINTPTYPIPEKLEDGIWRKGATRCIAMGRVDAKILAQIQQELAHSVCKDYIECFEDGWEEGDISIRFHSIKMAGIGFDLFNGRIKYDDCRVHFVNDPCTRKP